MPKPPDVSGPMAYGILAGYLLDQIPAEEAAPAVAWLSGEPADPIAQQIAGWANEQIVERNLPLGAFQLYGLEKLYILGARKLLDPNALIKFLDALAMALLRETPESDREAFRSGYVALRTSGKTEATRPSVSVAKPVSVDPGAAASARATIKAEKQLSLILERFEKRPKKKASEEAEAQEAAQIVTIAARSAKTSAQLDELLAQIEKSTGKKKGNVFATLGGGLPSWDLPIPEKSPDRKLPAQVEAIGKIISLAENPTIALQRLRDLVTAAIEKFNEGKLAAAMWMFDVAEDAVKEKKVGAAAVEKIRDETMDNLAAVQIRKYVESKSKHAALRLTLDFFPRMRLDALFTQLRGEPRADKRRSLLGLIETHDQKAREQALKRLEAEIARRDADTYYLRNLVYVLHRIPRENDEALPRLLNVLARLTSKGQNIYVIKEAATALGQIKTEDSVKILTTCLAEMEAMLSRNDVSLYPITEMQKTLDRAIGSIARIGTPGALLTVARHGMKTNPALGDTRVHFSLLAEQDLSFQTQVVEVLTKALRDELPGRLLGRFGAKKQDSTVRLIEALSGTRTDDVDELMRDIASRFADQEIGIAAGKVLAKWGRTKGPEGAEPAATLSGELAFFGLPSVLQSLAEMKATGILTITTKEGAITSRMTISEGKLAGAETGHLRGEDGFYEMLERPIPGRFAFVPYPPERITPSIEPQNIVGLLFEAVRRQDELQLLTTLVPDDLPLQATGTRPGAPEGETDAELMKTVWLKTIAGAPVGEWGHEIPTDSFRIRRMLAHWLEAGAVAAKG